MLASQIAGKVDLGWTVVAIRKLNARSLRKASEARQIAFAQTVTRLAEALKALGDRPGDDKQGGAEASAEQRDAQRYGAYDRETVLTQGVTGGLPDPLAASLEDLTSEDEDKVFKAIIDLSVPRKEEAEAAAKNA